jgi:hypothetical protein
LKILDGLDLLIAEADVKVYTLSGIRISLQMTLSDIDRLEREFQLIRNLLVQQRMAELQKRTEDIQIAAD